MNNGSQIRPPFFGNVPNMIPQPQPQPSPFHPNIPPPNFSLPPPTMPPGGQFPRFSGPMHNQPTYNPAAGGIRNIVPPALPVMNLPPVYNVNNNTNNNQAGGNQAQMFNHGIPGQWSNSIVNNNQHPYPTNQQRQMPNLSNDIFSDAPKEIQCGFPNYKPTIPPPLQNSVTPSPMPPVMMNQRGGMTGRGGGFHQGNNGFHSHNNNNNSNNNSNNNNNHSNNNGHNNHGYNNYNNNKGRGGFRGGMNNRGRGNFHHKDKGVNNNNNNTRNDGVQKTKEPKVDKRDLPENNVFYCDTCDRGFKNEEKYTEHVDQHQKCTYKDCPFVAAPKLVQLHMNMQHRQGLANRIYGVKSEADIKKWREERRKNYPTADNIKKKKEKREEMIGRGEVIETKEFGKMRGQNRGRGRDRGRGRGRDRFGRDRGYGMGKEVIDVDEDDDGPPEEKKIERSRIKVEDELTNGALSDDDESPGQKMEKKKKKKANVDLTSQSSPTKKSKSDDQSLSLLSGYGSDSDDSSSDEDVDVKSGNKTNTKGPKHTGNTFGLISGTKYNNTGDDNCTTNVESMPKRGEKDVCDSARQVKSRTSGVNPAPEVNNGTSGVNPAPEVKSGTSEVKDVKRSHGNKGSGPPNKKPKFTPKPLPKSHTLLEKLLAKEIRRERNKILQCIHFIVKNKFFDQTASD